MGSLYKSAKVGVTVEVVPYEVAEEASSSKPVLIAIALPIRAPITIDFIL